MSANADTTADAATAPKGAPEADPVIAVDLFAGAGGLSTGLALACEALDRDVELVAVNHWGPAIETHEQNHPWATQLHAEVESLHPPDAVPGDVPHVDILVAAPECTHFSTARGGKPVTEQKRASPWHVLDWVEKLDVENILFENVPEFQSWGPIEDGQPTRNGEIFDVWIDTLHALGYSVDWDTLNAADYGDPTSRTRLFVIGRRGRRAAFPEPTHAEVPAPDDDRAPWRTAAEIIDWTAPGGSIWTRDLNDGRKQPLKYTTMRRIAEGIRRHCADCLKPLADALTWIGRVEPTDEVDPANFTSIETLRETAVPAWAASHVAQVHDEPFLVACGGQARLGLTVPYLLRQQSGGVPSPAYDPVPTVASAGAIATVAPRPLVMPRNGTYRGLHSNPLYQPEECPLHTVTAKNTDGYLVTPYLCPLYNGRAGQRPRTRRVDRPLMTVPASKSPAGIAHPAAFLVDYHGNSAVQALDAPLGSLETRDRYALCVPDLYPWGLDIRYRMLQPRELKQAQGFPADYEIVGTKTETTKQIGNAVPVNLATALCRKLLTGQEPSLQTFTTGDDTDDSGRARPRTRVETPAND